MTKVVMISGASRGIGAAIARRLYSVGYALSIGVRTPNAVDKVQFPDESRALWCQYDACDTNAGQKWVEETVERFRVLNAVINNAGILKNVTVEDDDEDAYAELWNVNVMAPLRVSRAALPHLRKVGNGRIINMVSLAGKRVKGTEAGYAMTKHALLALTHSLRKAGWADGIRATAICPGLVGTDMASGTTELLAAEMVQPDDIANVVALLLELPNNASVSEMPINCRFEDCY